MTSQELFEFFTQSCRFAALAAENDINLESEAGAYVIQLRKLIDEYKPKPAPERLDIIQIAGIEDDIKNTLQNIKMTAIYRQKEAQKQKDQEERESQKREEENQEGEN